MHVRKGQLKEGLMQLAWPNKCDHSKEAMLHCVRSVHSENWCNLGNYIMTAADTMCPNCLHCKDEVGILVFMESAFRDDPKVHQAYHPECWGMASSREQYASKEINISSWLSYHVWLT